MEKKEIIGRNPVLEYLRTLEPGQDAELFISASAHGKIIEIIAAEARRAAIKITYAQKEFFSRVDSSSRHQGVMLRIVARGPQVRDDEFIAELATRSGVIVALDQLTDPHNIGSIIRTAEALGAGGVIMTKAHAPEINQTIIKTSAGATAHIRIMHVGNIAQTLEKAREAGFWIIGTSDEGDTGMEKLHELRPAILIIGSEGSGMRRLTGEKCDYLVRIPLRGHISSLNASVAAGILLWELLRIDD
jgi:23S rRNA (guanosine2251-2'-O)-methyltransferase